MRNKSEMFAELPPELKLEAAHNLSNRDSVNLAQTSKYHAALFKSMVDVRRILRHVVCGEHDAVQSMLEDNIRLIFKKGIVTDCSGREFENISGFEYALWALDKHMWSTMIACIPSHEEGRKIVAQLVAQYNNVNLFGITYRLHGKTITEQHFDFENTIIKALRTQVALINAPGDKHWDAIDKQWQEGVGGAQRRLPMHVVHEYCSNEPFYPVPKFTSRPISSKQFYNWTTNEEKNWFNVDSRIGFELAVYKGAWGRPFCGAFARGRIRGLLRDLDAMRALYEVRTLDFVSLSYQLEEQVSAYDQYQVISV